MSSDAEHPEPLHPGLFRIDGDGRITLLGGRSEHSGQSHFPRQELCPYSGADDVVDIELARTGTLVGWTTVNIAPPGYFGVVPYGLGIVELDGAPTLKIIGRLTVADVDAWNEGDPVVVVADVVSRSAETGPGAGPDPSATDVVTWAFAPVSS